MSAIKAVVIAITAAVRPVTVVNVGSRTLPVTSINPPTAAIRPRPLPAAANARCLPP